MPKLLKIKEDSTGKTDFKDYLADRNDFSKRILDIVKDIARAICEFQKTGRKKFESK